MAEDVENLTVAEALELWKTAVKEGKKNESAVEKFVAELSEPSVIEILTDYENLRRVGYIEASRPLRIHAQAVMSLLATSGSTGFWMEALAGECYRRLAHSYIGRVISLMDTPTTHAYRTGR